MNALMPNPQMKADYSIPGFRITPCDPSTPWSFVVRTAEKREDWVAYQPDEIGRAAEVETTIIYQGKAYRIAQAAETQTGWAYRLQPYPENEQRRKTFELSAENVLKTDEERRQFDQMMRMTETSVYYQFLFGFLPAAIQNELSRKLHFGPGEATRVNGFIEAQLCGALSLVFMLCAIKGIRPLGLSPFYLVILMVICCTEGFARWSIARQDDEPIGSLFLELPYRLYVRFRDRNR